MYRVGVVIVDATVARLLTYESDDRTGTGEGGQLIEHQVLRNPERRLRASEALSETRPGLSRAPAGPAFGVDDHRERHQRELEERFAAEIIRNLGDLLADRPASRIVIASGPNMLGVLRRALTSLSAHLPFDDIPLNLARETPSRLHDRLARMGLLPSPARVLRRSHR